jgi:hypothetical protein
VGAIVKMEASQSFEKGSVYFISGKDSPSRYQRLRAFTRAAGENVAALAGLGIIFTGVAISRAGLPQLGGLSMGLSQINKLLSSQVLRARASQDARTSLQRRGFLIFKVEQSYSKSTKISMGKLNIWGSQRR